MKNYPLPERRLFYILTAAALISLLVGVAYQPSLSGSAPAPSREKLRRPPIRQTPRPTAPRTLPAGSSEALTEMAENAPADLELAQMTKHAAVQQFLNSPARDTAACREILSRLLENGYGIEHLQPVYNAAWEVRKWDPAYAAIYAAGPAGQTLIDPNDPEHRDRLADLRQGTKQRLIEELARGLHGAVVNNRQLLTSLLDIRPKVFYGQSLAVAVNSQNRLLDEQDVLRYVRAQSVSDPLESQTRYAPDRETVAELERQLYAKNP
jgi:hypothetical protein